MPRMPKKVRQMLDLTGYYHKLISTYAYVVWPLNQLIHKTVLLIWTDQCKEAFDILKKALMNSSISVYQDPKQRYTLFTDALKYALSAVLTQEHASINDSKTVNHQHSITCVIRLFQGSEPNFSV